MLRPIALIIGIGLLLFITLPVFHLLSFSEEIATNQGSVQYTLPFPGILPDNVLYPVKIIRDRSIELVTRDAIKKAELYLHMADKRVAMAELLAERGKSTLAVTTLSKGEKYFLQIPKLLEESRGQGVAPTGDFILRLKLSNEKHMEVIKRFINTLPQGEIATLNQLKEMNEEIQRNIAPF